MGPLHRHHCGGGFGCGEGRRQSGARAARGATGGAVEEAATWTTWTAPWEVERENHPTVLFG